MNRIHWLLIFGISLSPMTLLRIGKVGPSEILILFWAIYIIYIYKDKVFRKDIFINFWIIYFSLIVFSSLIPAFIDAPVSGVMRDLITYTFLIIFIVSMIIFCQNNNESLITLILFKIFSLSSIIYTFIYFYSIIVSPNLLGISLWFGGTRFSGGAINPHQLAFLTGPLIGIGLYFLFSIKNNIKLKLITFISSLMLLLISLETESSTLIISLLIMLLTIIGTKVIEFNKTILSKISASFLMIASILTIILLIKDKIFQAIMNFIYSDQNGYGRIELVIKSLEVFNISPFIGLGLGAHIPKPNGSVMETHNQYMEILLNTGLLGVINLIVLYFILSKKFFYNKYFLGVFLFFVIYGLGGFGLRRLIFWYLLITMFYIVVQNSKNKCISNRVSI